MNGVSEHLKQTKEKETNLLKRRAISPIGRVSKYENEGGKSDSTVVTTDLEASLPGVSANTKADAATPPASWAIQYSTKRTGFNAPTSSNAKLIFGLNTAPVTL